MYSSGVWEFCFRGSLILLYFEKAGDRCSHFCSKLAPRLHYNIPCMFFIVDFFQYAYLSLMEELPDA